MDSCYNYDIIRTLNLLFTFFYLTVCSNISKYIPSLLRSYCYNYFLFSTLSKNSVGGLINVVKTSPQNALPEA